MTIAASRITGNTAPNDKAGNPGIGGGIGNLPSMGGVPGTGVLTVRNSVISGDSGPVADAMLDEVTGKA